MNKQSAYYSPLELIAWQSRLATASAVAAHEPITTDLERLGDCVANCTACPLSQSRTQSVFGSGNRQAQLMIIGEAPGSEEDKQGAPFVGRAGQLLTAMLQSIGVTRDEVYITNLLKCRPPENRDPTAEEIRTCTPYLAEQIKLVQPTLLLAVGRIASQYLLQSKNSVESLRGQIHRYGETQIPLIVTYHPAYLLRSPADKKKAYADLLYMTNTLKNLR